MKKYLSILSAVLCLGLYSCQEKPIEPVVYGPSVLISNYGLRSENILDDKDVPQEFLIYTECDGAYDGEVKVSLTRDEAALNAYNLANGTSYRALPANCYNLDASSKTMSGKRAEFVVTFNVEEIASLAKVYDYSDIKDYVVPFAIVSETTGLEAETLDGVNYIFVNPKMTHKIVEKFSLVGPSADGVTITNDAYTIAYRIVPEDNRWASGYDFDMTVTDAKDVALVEGIDYVISCSSEEEAFAIGDSEITYTLSFPTSALSALPADIKLKVKAELKGVENGFIVDGTGVSSLTFEPYPLWDKSGVTAADVAGSCPGDSGNTGPICAFDGKLNTFWKNQNVSPVEPSPWLLQLNLKQNVTIHALGIYGRQELNQRPGACRTGGFRFDNTMTDIVVPAEQCRNNGQWNWDSNLDAVKSLFDVFYNYDYKMVVEGAAAPGGGADALSYYLDPHWVILDEDVTTSVLQWWIISESSWDRPVATVNGSGGNRFSQAAELEIRLGGAPKLTIE